jgi:hypothetical protein
VTTQQIPKIQYVTNHCEDNLLICMYNFLNYRFHNLYLNTKAYSATFYIFFCYVGHIMYAIVILFYFSLCTLNAKWFDLKYSIPCWYYNGSKLFFFQHTIYAFKACFLYYYASTIND